MKNRIQLFFLFPFLISLDQLLKFLFIENSVCNKNITWSIPIAPGFFYLIWIIIFIFLIYYFKKSHNSIEKIAFIFVFSGAVSNFADRITRGCVTDFINLKIWPVFNLADVYITIGIAMLILNIIKRKNREATP